MAVAHSELWTVLVSLILSGVCVLALRQQRKAPRQKATCAHSKPVVVSRGYVLTQDRDALWCPICGSYKSQMSDVWIAPEW
jgi:hypothetical protein